MAVEHRCPFVESSGMPRILELEEVEIEMMAELVAERAQKCPERGDVLAYRSPHPQANGVIVAEEFGGPVFSRLQRSGREHADAAPRNPVERCGAFEELSTWTLDAGGSSRLHGHLYRRCNGSKKRLTWQVIRLRPVALTKALLVSASYS